MTRRRTSLAARWLQLAGVVLVALPMLGAGAWAFGLLLEAVGMR